MNETDRSAIGLVETRGLVALVEATDAMAKTENVHVLRRVSIGGGYVTTVISGELEAVQAAVAAGAAAARQAGELIASHVIARASDGLMAAYFL